MNQMENTGLRSKIQNLNQEISLNQCSYLLDCILKLDRDLWGKEEVKSKLWKNIEMLTEKKYRYLLHLFFSIRDSKPQSEDRWLAKEKFAKEINQLIEL